MTERIVQPRVRRGERPSSPDFLFAREMVPLPTKDGQASQLLREFRLRAFDTFASLPLPTTSEEAWRRTDLRGLNASSFRLPEIGAYADFPALPPDLLQPLVSDQHGGQMVLSKGGVQFSASPELAAKGVIFTDLMTAEREHAELLARLKGQIIRPEEGKFAALAAAFAHDGLLIYLPRGVQLAQPLHTILWGAGVGLAQCSHLIVWVEDGASLTYVHETASPPEAAGQSLHAGLVELYVGAEANLRFVELQSWGQQVWNFTHERLRAGRKSNVEWIFAAVGSHLTKSFADLALTGDGASGRMSGFYFTNGVQHLDHDTQQNHLAAHTTSDLLFKGALKDRSRSVWQGMIYVAPGAQKADGYQANRNLTLSRQARADSIPGLEILADDVRCTHGATVGKIDPNEIFYLRSRGIPKDEAERLIVEGFFDPIMQRIPFEGVRARLQKAIAEKMA